MRIETSQIDYLEEEKDPATLRCVADSNPPATILWRKDGLVLSSNTRISLNQQTLQIYNLQREDYGVYQCFVTRGNREVQATAQLRLGGEDIVIVFSKKLKQIRQIT